MTRIYNARQKFICFIQMPLISAFHLVMYKYCCVDWFLATTNKDLLIWQGTCFISCKFFTIKIREEKIRGTLLIPKRGN